MDSHLATKIQVKQVIEGEKIDLGIVASQGVRVCLLVDAIQHITAPSQVLRNGILGYWQSKVVGGVKLPNQLANKPREHKADCE
jgi:hypothetical protein